MPALTERSAGFILYHRAPGGPQILLLDYGKYWDYPKGHVEAREDDLAAARRECAEETGITEVEVHPDFRHEIAYFFRGRRGLIRKEVVFFLAHTDSLRVTLSQEHTGYEWLPLDAALKRVTYASAKQVLRTASVYLIPSPGPPGEG